ncbi:hypothetical protein EII17_01755 [Clostridiales bacterium COT073_COT-073]|nr:hypothetical protein EII17_01755 [Clostridiales bacterium COT073_COT-073]
MEKQAMEMLRQIANSHSRALRLLNDTVDYVRDEVIDEAVDCLSEGREVFLMGVKNTSAISREYVERLQRHGFLLHTLDNIGEKGRAIYTGVKNPLTGMPMTGSSATTASHVLQNINQIGIGTDGGGSVLAPAIACGLYAIIGKGIGLVGTGNRISTDGIRFEPAIGVLSQQYELCRRAIQILLENKANNGSNDIDKKLETTTKEIAVVLWDDEDDIWFETVASVLAHASLRVFKKKKTTKREELLGIYNEIIEKVPIMISHEGPIDVDGLGDSIVGGFGKIGSQIQEKGQKYFVKIANLVDATGVAIPDEELASGYLILGKKGISYGCQAMEIGSAFAQKVGRPKVFTDYFFGPSPGKGFI